MQTNCQTLRRAKNLTLCLGFFMTLRRPMYCHFLLTLGRFLKYFMSARCSAIFILTLFAVKNEFMSDRCKVVYYVITSGIKK
jgi:hypothetical protein